MVEDPERLSSGFTEGPFTCPICSKRINLELPPDRVQRRMGPRQRSFPSARNAAKSFFDTEAILAIAGTSIHRRRRSTPRNRSRPERLGDAAGVDLLRRRRSEDLKGAPLVEMDERACGGLLWCNLRPHRSAGTRKITSRDDWQSTGFDREISGPCKTATRAGWQR